MKSVFFVKGASTAEDLKRIHPLDMRRPYKIEKIIRLGDIDYKNFIEDLRPERWFISENAELCRVDGEGVWHSLLILGGGRDGILVMSAGAVYPMWAAYLENAAETEDL